MRRFFFSALLLTLIAGVASADFTGTGDGNAFIDNASVSSTINVSGTTGTITGVEVTINAMEHTWLGDLTATLDNGTTSVTLFERVGQIGGAGFGDNVDTSGDFTFSDDGSDSLWAESAGVTSLDGTGFDFSTSGADDVATSLGDFFGQSKDGDWTLTISDGAGGDSGQYAGWTLNLISSGTTVPEPTTFGLLVGFAGLVAARRRR